VRPNHSVNLRANGMPPGPSRGTVYIFCSSGLASRRRLQVTSNVRRSAMERSCSWFSLSTLARALVESAVVGRALTPAACSARALRSSPLASRFVRAARKHRSLFGPQMRVTAGAAGTLLVRPGWRGYLGRPLPTGAVPSLTAPPNPPLKRSANGMPPGPGCRYAVHFLQPGPGVIPSSPA
jgi:hypothetical protein